MTDGARQYMNSDETATYLRCSTRRVWDLVHQRRIPHTKEGGRLLFERSEIDAWLDASKVDVA